jgi:hypothetical protein
MTEGRGQRIDDRDQRTGGEGQIVEGKKLRRCEGMSGYCLYPDSGGKPRIKG